MKRFKSRMEIRDARTTARPARREQRAAGWHDYSLFLRDDGLLVGYLRTENLAAAQAAMQATEVNRRWQAEMAPFFVDLPGGRPDTGMTLLDEVFNLDAQLDRAQHMGDDDD